MKRTQLLFRWNGSKGLRERLFRLSHYYTESYRKIANGLRHPIVHMFSQNSHIYRKEGLRDLLS